MKWSYCTYRPCLEETAIIARPRKPGMRWMHAGRGLLHPAYVDLWELHVTLLGMVLFFCVVL